MREAKGAVKIHYTTDVSSWQKSDTQDISNQIQDRNEHAIFHFAHILFNWWEVWPSDKVTLYRPCPSLPCSWPSYGVATGKLR